MHCARIQGFDRALRPRPNAARHCACGNPSNWLAGSSLVCSHAHVTEHCACVRCAVWSNVPSIALVHTGRAPPPLHCARKSGPGHRAPCIALVFIPGHRAPCIALVFLAVRVCARVPPPRTACEGSRSDIVGSEGICCVWHWDLIGRRRPLRPLWPALSCNGRVSLYQ